MVNKQIPWTRYWFKDDDRIESDGAYLANPESLLGFSKAKSLLELNDTPCLILVGEPGAGKSQEAIQLKNHLDALGEPNLYLNLKTIQDDLRLQRKLFQSEQFKNWVQGEHVLTLIIDSLDECILHYPTIATSLIDDLNDIPTSRLKIRITCRSVDLPISLTNNLKNIWGAEQVEVYRLAHLTRKNVELAATVVLKDNATKFLQQLNGAELDAFATLPVTLFMLLQKFSETCEIRGSRADLYYRYCRHLCEEHERETIGRKKRPNPDKRLAVAERLAVLAIFTGKSMVFLGDGLPEKVTHELIVEDVLGGTETTEHGNLFEVDREAVLDALDSMLLEGNPHRSWSHWTYAEFLAARYLVRRKVEKEKVFSLISNTAAFDDGPTIPPQIREVAAWLAGMDTEILEGIVDTDPVFLLRTQAAVEDYELRTKLVSSLLRQIEEAKIPDLQRLRDNLEVLSHPGLKEQLLPYITGIRGGLFVRRVAIDIAEACKVQDMADCLLNLALDRNEVIGLRVEAVHAVGVVGLPQQKMALSSLLSSDENDPDDELRGNALRILWPDYMQKEHIFQHLTPEKRSNLFGQYKYFLRYVVPSKLTPELLPLALAWARTVPLRERVEVSTRHELVSEILRMAWANMHCNGVVAPLAEIIFERIKNHLPVFGDRISSKQPEEFVTEPELRRTIVLAISKIVQLPQDMDAWESVAFSELLSVADFEWAAEQLELATLERDQELWAPIVFFIYDRDNAQHFEKIYSLKSNIISLERRCGHLFKAVDLDSDEAKRQKKNWRRMNQKKAALSPTPNYSELIETRLANWKKADLNSWWLLCLDLRLVPGYDNNYQYEDEFNPDLTITPGWEAISEKLKNNIVQVASEYLACCDPQTEEWFGKNIFHRPAGAGYYALWLLWKTNKGKLEKLKSEVWQKWAPIIVGFPDFPNGDEDPSLILTKYAYLAAPDEMLKFLSLSLDNEEKQGHSPSTHRRFKLGWDEQLTEVLIERILNPSMLPQNIGTLLDWLVDLGMGLERALESAERLFLQKREEESAHKTATIAGAVLLLNGGERGWRIVESIIGSDKNFGKEVFLEAATRREFLSRGMSALSPLTLKALFLALAEAFPYSEDPHIVGAHAISPREMASRFRDSILDALKNCGDSEAVLAIYDIAENLGLDWIRYHAAEGRSVVLAKNWHPLSPKQLLNFISEDERMLVQDAEGLKRVVLQSLERYQAKILGEGGLSHELWNTDTMRPKGEEEISFSIRGFLQTDLMERKIVCNRNVDIGPYKEIDIRVEAFDDSKKEKLCVILEVKGNWHREVDTAMESQLRNTYLKENNETNQGIYLVLWFPGEQVKVTAKRNKSRAQSIGEARDFFKRQAENLSVGWAKLSSFVLDVTLPMPRDK